MGEGILCVVSGPSGSGKTTLCRALSEREERVVETAAVPHRAQQNLPLPPPGRFRLLGPMRPAHVRPVRVPAADSIGSRRSHSSCAKAG